MASLMEDLADVLLQEDKQYQELIVLSKEKTDVLVAGNVKRLEEITAMEQEMTDVLHGSAPQNYLTGYGRCTG